MKGMHFKSEIAQRELSDFWRGIHAWRKTSFLHIRFSTDREPVGSQDFTLSGEGG